MYEIALRRKAEKFLDSLDQKTAQRLGNALLDLKDFPLRGDLKKLSGSCQGMFRLRVGDYRILFTVDEKSKAIYVYLIDHRSGVY